MDEFSPLFSIVLLFIGLSILLHSVTVRTGSPVLAILSRWLRWISMSLALAYLIVSFGWSDRPFWLLSLTVFLGWFIFETGISWLSISALSRSDMPLFPRFRENTSGQEWPMQKNLFRLRDWLRENGFKKRVALEARMPGGADLKCSVFESVDATIRAYIHFFPLRNGGTTSTFSLATKTEDGTTVITDNSFIPFGGFYPDNYYVVRKPLLRSFQKLVRLHEKRIARFSDEVIAMWVSDPVDDLNTQQREIERINTDLGFLLPLEEQEEYGRISREGRYRIWKEIWLMNYLGWSRRY
ncbi:MAG: hypothetical protein JJT75_13035 [Opitutales bacterium]|nr:hypothetical protein [Opitutales bacterium]MCH8540175.1 hypothetical protein [Opitutales bacterium]